jgi:hypothetical protein
MDANRVANLLPNRFGSFQLGSAIGVNLNATGDTFISLLGNPSKYRITKIAVTNSSAASPSTVNLGIFTAASAGGTAIVTAGTLLSSGLASTAAILNLTIVTAVGNTVLTNATAGGIYLNVATAQGSAATIDIYVWGDIIQN